VPTLVRLLFDFTPPEKAPDCDLSQAEYVVAIPFGGHGLAQPTGVVNRYLAALAEEWSRKLDCPILTQWEIRQALPIIPRPEIIVGEVGDFHINTRQFAERLKERIGSVPFIAIAQLDHAKRFDWTCRKLGMNPLWPRLGEEMYDPKSRQWWARNKLSWRMWECAARIKFWFKGWI